MSNEFKTCSDCREFHLASISFFRWDYASGTCDHALSDMHNAGMYQGCFTEACKYFIPKEEGVEG